MRSSGAVSRFGGRDWRSEPEAALRQLRRRFRQRRTPPTCERAAASGGQRRDASPPWPQRVGGGSAHPDRPVRGARRARGRRKCLRPMFRTLAGSAGEDAGQPRDDGSGERGRRGAAGEEEGGAGWWEGRGAAMRGPPRWRRGAADGRSRVKPHRAKLSAPGRSRASVRAEASASAARREAPPPAGGGGGPAAQECPTQ